MEPINLNEYEALAQTRIEPTAWDFYQGGSDDEVTLRANRSVFERIRLRPRMLVDVSNLELSTTVLGTPVSMPILVAPTAYQCMAHPEGECATAQGTGMARTLMTASTVSTRSLEEIANAASGPLWFQLYTYQSPQLSEMVIRRAEAAGYRAIVLTVDLPRLGNREKDIRNNFRLPPHLHPANFAGIDLDDNIPGIIVSNHGGRQLDTALTGIEALPEIVEAAAGRCEVYVDGGIRRGTDVLKALALGARAVLVGRPVLWGLAVNGAEGVRHVLELLRAEFELAMALAGRPTLESIDRSLVKFV